MPFTYYSMIIEFNAPPITEAMVEGYQKKHPEMTSKANVMLALEQAEREKRLKWLLGLKQQDDISPEKAQILKKYLQDYAESTTLGRYLFGAAFALAQNDHKQSANQSFYTLNEQYHYFDTHNLMHCAIYWECFKFCLYQTTFVEPSGLPVEVETIYQYAYKMMALFASEAFDDSPIENTKKIISSLGKFIIQHLPETQQPIQDLFVHALPSYTPDEPKFNLVKWKKNLQSLGMPLIQNFGNITVMEAMHQGIIPKDAKQLKRKLRQRCYPDSEFYSALADLYEYYDIDPEVWEKTLAYIQDGTLKTTPDGKIINKVLDSIPDVKIAVRSHSKERYYWVKLPIGDPRTLILGEITNCCQYIGGNSELCVLDGVTEAHNGFYVLIKSAKVLEDPIDWDHLEQNKHRIVGQAYVWRGTTGGLVLDSLEVLTSFRDQFDLTVLLEKFAQAVYQYDPRIHRILIGKNRNTNAILKAQKIKKNATFMPEDMLIGIQYGDSLAQYEISISDELEATRENLARETRFLDQSHIVSPAQRQILLSENQHILEYVKKDESLYRFLTLPHHEPYCMRSLYETLLRLKDSNFSCYQYILDNNDVKEASKIIPIQALLSLPLPKITALTSLSARECYQDEYATIMELKDLEADTITALTSDSAQTCYYNEYMTFAHLKDLDLREIEVLLSDKAMLQYQSGITFEEYAARLGITIKYRQKRSAPTLRMC